MSPLRLRIIEDLKLAGLARSTQAVYVDAVRKLAAHYRRSVTAEAAPTSAKPSVQPIAGARIDGFRKGSTHPTVPAP
jgi:hypothetical protein